MKPAVAAVALLLSLLLLSHVIAVPAILVPIGIFLGGAVTGAAVTWLWSTLLTPQPASYDDTVIRNYAELLAAKYTDAMNMAAKSAATLAEASRTSSLYLTRLAEAEALTVLDANTSADTLSWRALTSIAPYIANTSRYLHEQIAAVWHAAVAQMKSLTGKYAEKIFMRATAVIGNDADMRGMSGTGWVGWYFRISYDREIFLVGGGKVYFRSYPTAVRILLTDMYGNVLMNGTAPSSGLVMDLKEAGVYRLFIDVTTGSYTYIATQMPTVTIEPEGVAYVENYLYSGFYIYYSGTKIGSKISPDSSCVKHVHSELAACISSIRSYAISMIYYLRALGYTSPSEIPPDMWVLPPDVLVAGSDDWRKLNAHEILALYISVLQAVERTMTAFPNITKITVNWAEVPFLNPSVKIRGYATRNGTRYIGAENHTLLIMASSPLRVMRGENVIGNYTGYLYDLNTREIAQFMPGDVLYITEIYARVGDRWDSVEEAEVQLTSAGTYVAALSTHSPVQPAQSQKSSWWKWGLIGAGALIFIVATTLIRRPRYR
ncbi:MAG: hypothetical protein QXY39_06905 [Thermofilaceae archaeon]